MSQTRNASEQHEASVFFSHNGRQDPLTMTSPGSPPEYLAMPGSDSQTSEEDYDDITHPTAANVRNRKDGSASANGIQRPDKPLTPLQLEKNERAFILRDDGDLREILRRGLQRAKDPSGKTKNRAKFSDLVFTRKFSTFDRQNEDAANSPFHGFFTLFWISVFIFMLKVGAENWRKWGNPLGTNEIMQGMFRRDLLVLLAADGLMCGITGISWVLQKLIYAGYIDWDRAGWVIQNVSLTIPAMYELGTNENSPVSCGRLCSLLACLVCRL